MVQPVRRLVTGHDSDGKSIFLEDGLAPNVRSIEAAGGMKVTELWYTDRTPADNSGSENAVKGDFAIAPPADGSKFRIIDYPPDSVRFGSADREAIYREMGASHNLVTEDPPHPGMHKTDSVDYALILSGEIYAVMDEGERLMKAGDVLVQRGTSHAWSNRTDEIARVAFILIGADPV